MFLLWDYYWPVAAAALVIGIVAGTIAYRPARPTRRHRMLTIGGGALAVLVLGAIWHGPVGTADRFAALVEREARATLVAFEMEAIEARLERAPLSRRFLLSGPADDFQRGELARIIGDIPGASSARWTDSDRGPSIPLLGEVELLALVAFGLGLALAYLIALRRRARAEWRW